MKKYGESVEDIMRETGLTEQEIENLKIWGSWKTEDEFQPQFSV
jgi:hypothetical protein